jgi:hypothetical protein
MNRSDCCAGDTYYLLLCLAPSEAKHEVTPSEVHCRYSFWRGAHFLLLYAELRLRKFRRGVLRRVFVRRRPDRMVQQVIDLIVPL